MDAAIDILQKPFLSEAQISSSRAIMGLDTQLIKDETYFIVGLKASWRGAGDGADGQPCMVVTVSPGRDAALLDPLKDAARIRAMYTHPVLPAVASGDLILTLCEEAARLEGFRRIELGADYGGRTSLPDMRL